MQAQPTPPPPTPDASAAHADSTPGREILARLASLAPGVALAGELAACPDPDGALLALTELVESDAEGCGRLLANPGGRAALLAVAAAGPFPAGLLTRVPEAVAVMVRAAGDDPFPWPEPPQLADVADFAGLQRRLRQLKMAAFLDLVARDLSGGCSLFDATEGLSRLASVALDAALLFCRRELAERHGDCVRDDGEPVPFMVLGMGKLGAGELNYASDIDLITFYGDGGGETTGRRPLSPSEFFARLTHRVVQAVAETTDSGRVFRVDLRLRPEGAGGATAWSRAAAMAYYETLGDTWERAAFIKAHPVAGDREAAGRLLGEMAPFVYRRYLDFAALEGIRSVKERIRARQRTREALGTDVKLGRGGIREIEFFVQALQLIHAGKQPKLRHRRTFDALAALVAEGHVTETDAARLREHYLFLRNVEHRVQLVAEEQTHLLPVHPGARRRLARQMGHAVADPWAAFADRYREVTDEVHRIVDTLFHEPEGAGVGVGDTAFEALATALDQLPEGADLTALRLRDPVTGRGHLLALGRHIHAAWQTEQGRARWRRLLPLFLADIAGGADPDMGLAGLECFVESLRGRSIYAAMLMENPHSRVLLSRLFCASRFLSGLLARHPALLDELLTPRALLSERSVAMLEAELAQSTQGLGEEAWLDAVRRFKHREVLRVGLTELLTGMDERARGVALARLAEAIIRQVLAWSQAGLVERHGLPPAADGGPGQVAVVGMGRIGSGEMGYASDLDLVFVHNGDPGASTPGPKAVTVGDFYARLGRRIVSCLTLPTGEGVLYEVDMRLRPSGSSGQLVTSLAAFRRYQKEEAWTWEKQALTRARVVAASGDFGDAVTAALREACYVPRDLPRLAAEVREMRAKMAAHLASGQAGTRVEARAERVDLKQDAGGIVDIEFTVQYLLLAHGHAHPEVVDSNPRVALERLADAGLLARADADRLLAALALYRTVEGLLQRVQGESVRVLARQGDPLPEGREHWFAQVQVAQKRVREVYTRVLGRVPGVEGENPVVEN